jgi:anaphase-promoting complex subunit 2
VGHEEAEAGGDAGGDSDGEDEVEGGLNSEAAMRWVPDALQPGPCSDMYHKGSVDVIGMLVDIYGSTDLFLNEYRSLLSDKLLVN